MPPGGASEGARVGAGLAGAVGGLGSPTGSRSLSIRSPTSPLADLKSLFAASSTICTSPLDPVSALLERALGKSSSNRDAWSTRPSSRTAALCSRRRSCRVRTPPGSCSGSEEESARVTDPSGAALVEEPGAASVPTAASFAPGSPGSGEAFAGKPVSGLCGSGAADVSLSGGALAGGALAGAVFSGAVVGFVIGGADSGTIPASGAGTGSGGAGSRVEESSGMGAGCSCPETGCAGVSDSG